MNTQTPYKNLVPGRKYKIRLEDCCIRGEIFGTFRHWLDDDGNVIAAPVFGENDSERLDKAVFDNRKFNGSRVYGEYFDLSEADLEYLFMMLDEEWVHYE